MMPLYRLHFISISLQCLELPLGVRVVGMEYGAHGFAMEIYPNVINTYIYEYNVSSFKS